MGKFRDQAGNIWEVGPDGQPVFVSGPQQSIQTKPADPTQQFKAPTAQANLTGQALSNQRTAAELQNIPLERENKGLSNQKTAQDIRFDRANAASDLAGKFAKDQRVVDYRTVLPMLASSLAADKGKQGDLTVVYAWAKAMDPQGSVREGDTDMATGTSSYIQQAMQYVSRINQGKGLPPEVRKGLINEIRNKTAVLNQAYGEARNQYSDLAKQGDIPAATIIGPHDGEKYQGLESKYLGRPVRNGSEPKTASPGEFDHILSDMIEQRKPVAEIRQTLKDYGSTIPPFQEKILDQYEAARVAGQSPQVGVQTLPGADTAMGLAKGFKGAWDRAAVGTQNVFNAIPGLPDSNSASQAQQETQNYFAGQNVDPTAETLGRLGGATLFSSPIKAPALAGAVGNLLMTDSTSPGAMLRDAAVGAAGGKVADVALRGGAQLLAPMLDPSVKNLANEGARLTPGRFFPGLKKAEDLARSYPILGDKIDNALTQAESSVSRIPANRALGRIGETLPDDVPSGHQAVNYTEQKIGDFYNNTLAGRDVQIDPTFVTRMNYMGQRSGLRPQELDDLNDIVQREVGGMFANGKGKASARDFKRLDSKLGKMAGKLQASPDDPFKAQLGDQVEFVQEQMRHLMRRQNPDISADLRNADNAWADFVPYQRAAGMDLEGIPTPNMFKNAVRQNDNTLRKGATARGNARMQDFAIDAGRVIPAERPNSGTADRLNLSSLKAWGMGAMASPLYSEPAINLLNTLVKRPPDKVSQTIAEALRLPHTRGMFGAALPYYGINSGSGN